MQVACITRLVPQKGVHLIRHAIYRTLELGGQFVLLGSSPVPQIQESLGFLSSRVILRCCFLQFALQFLSDLDEDYSFPIF